MGDEDNYDTTKRNVLKQTKRGVTCRCGGVVFPRRPATKTEAELGRAGRLGGQCGGHPKTGQTPPSYLAHPRSQR